MKKQLYIVFTYYELRNREFEIQQNLRHVTEEKTKIDNSKISEDYKRRKGMEIGRNRNEGERIIKETRNYVCQKN